MNAILIKILAMGLALAQVTTDPDAVKTEFDPVADQDQIVRLLGEGCAHIRKEFDLEAINLDDLIATAMDDPQGLSGRIDMLRGLKFEDLFTVYQQFCKTSPAAEAAATAAVPAKADANDAVATEAVATEPFAIESPVVELTATQSPVDLKELALFYNEALADLPDHTKLKQDVTRTLTVVLDQKGGRFADIGEPSYRRIWVPLSAIPDHVQKAFVAAEDKRFFQHNGVDERGMIRALVGNLADPGRPQGGSTITQQVAKNLLVGSSVNFERKIRETVMASRLERTYSKPQILELYLNSIFFGRGAWGIEMAARSYFDKPAKELTVAEGALLAALIKGPSYLNPDRYPERAYGRLHYVLQRMVEDGAISSAQMQEARAKLPATTEYSSRRRDSGFYFVDHVNREARDLAGIETLADSSYIVRSTVDPALQRAVETSLQEGLARYERSSRRLEFSGPETNLSDPIRRIEAERSLSESVASAPDVVAEESGARNEEQPPAWLVALQRARLPLYDVHWTPAVIVEAPEGKGSGFRVGLSDGRVLPLNIPSSRIRDGLQLHDVVLTRIVNAGKRKTRWAELRVRPTVQGAAVVLDNKTGKILAMAGGFSYPLSQLNRTTQAWRQPGSALKPVTYLAALMAGMRPQSPVLDAAITLAPIDGIGVSWTPRNYSRTSGGQITLQQALERSRNLATVHLLDGGIANTPKESFARVCALAVRAKLYEECEPFYPFVLGAQPLRVIDLASFYTAIANEGVAPTPYAIESISRQGRVVYRYGATPVSLEDADPASLYQLKQMLQGVVSRGTAGSIRSLAPYVAGKTGTSNDAADAWFVGFSNEVTVAVWVGYDNADGQRRSLGEGATGNQVAAPIFGTIMQAVWTDYAPRTALAPASAKARLQIARLSEDTDNALRGNYQAHKAKGKSRAKARSRPRTPSVFAENRRYRARPSRGIFNGIFENVWGNRLR